MTLELNRDGAQLFRQAVDAKTIAELAVILPGDPGPGKRIFDHPKLARWLERGPAGNAARALIGDDARAVRAVLFDKTAAANWALGWHQDRTIAVREKIDVPGFQNWNRKAGAIHVEPQFEIIERMLTVRIHLDPVPDDNAPLLVAPGSHRMGRIPEHQIQTMVDQCGSFACLAERGDIWAYRTAILHSSDGAKNCGRRRVPQVDFSAETLPGGLRWLAVG